MRAAIITLAIAAAACRTCPSCPRCPTIEPARPPAEITVAPRAPCRLPPLPRPPHVGGVPQGNAVIVTQDTLAEIGRWVAGIYAWIDVATSCLVDVPDA